MDSGGSEMICTNTTKAGKRYLQRFAGVMVAYLATVWSVTTYVHAHHPTGVMLYLLAFAPAIDVIAMIGVVGLYLREEEDEFKRYQLVVSILWAIGITLAFTAVVDFLRSYGAIGPIPPFREFTIFWVSMGLVEGVQSLRNRVGSSE
jgi:hypothetical protein